MDYVCINISKDSWRLKILIGRELILNIQKGWRRGDGGAWGLEGVGRLESCQIISSYCHTPSQTF